MNRFSQFLCSAALIGGMFPLEATVSGSQDWLAYLGQQIDGIQAINVQQNLKAVPLQYLGGDPVLYDKPIQAPADCPLMAFSLLAVYDTEIALKRGERDRFLYLADFLYDTLVRKEVSWDACISDEREKKLIDEIRSHAACLMQKAGHKPLYSESKAKDVYRTTWNVRLRTAESINDLSFHQRVQEILMIQDDFENIKNFLAHQTEAFLANPAHWEAAHKSDPVALKSAQIVRYSPHFKSLKEFPELFRMAVEEDYNDRLNALWMPSELAQRIAEEEKLELGFVEPIVQSMYRAEIEKFIAYLTDLTAFIQCPRNIYAVECGATDGRSRNTCGLNSLLNRDAIRGDIQALRSESCALVDAFSVSSKAVQQDLHVALSKDPGRPRPLMLRSLASQSIQFESAGTSGSYGSIQVRRPTEDWFLNYQGQKIVQPGAVQSDLLELVAYAHDYNMIVLTRNVAPAPQKQAANFEPSANLEPVGVKTKFPQVKQATSTIRRSFVKPALQSAKGLLSSSSSSAETPTLKETSKPAERTSASPHPSHPIPTTFKVSFKGNIVTSSKTTAQTLRPIAHFSTVSGGRESNTLQKLVRQRRLSEKAGGLTQESLDVERAASSVKAHVLEEPILRNAPILSCLQSISVFSAYQEIRFLVHTPGHYQAVAFHSPMPQVLHYGAPTEWYKRHVKGVIQESQTEGK